MRAAVDLLTIVAVFGPLSTLLVLRVLPVLKQNDTPSVYTREYEVYWDDHLCTAVSRPASLVVSSISYKQSGKVHPKREAWVSIQWYTAAKKVGLLPVRSCFGIRVQQQQQCVQKTDV